MKKSIKPKYKRYCVINLNISKGYSIIAPSPVDAVGIAFTQEYGTHHIKSIVHGPNNVETVIISVDHHMNWYVN